MAWEQLECDTEILPFLEAVPEEEKKEEKELSPAEKELLDIILQSFLED